MWFSRLGVRPSRAARWVLVACGGWWCALVPAAAQVRCTMPNGVQITQQLGDCPRDAVAAERLDGTPIPVAAQPQVRAANGGVAAAPAAPSAQAPAVAEDGGGLSLGGWLVVGLLAFGLYAGLKGSAGASGPVRYCTSCGHQGKGRTKTRGSLLIEVVLWLCFLVPGLIYSIWRQGSKHKVCASCGASSLVPLNSPVARAALQVNAGDDEAAPDDADAWEGSFYDVAGQRSTARRVRIIYRDGDGAVSERVVQLRAFEPTGAAALVFGRCMLRNAMRTFRFDRMVRVTDEDTGEIITNLQEDLNAEWEASPEPVLDALYREHNDLLKMVLYAARADGAVRAAELQVIARHCVELTGDERITPALVKELLAAVDAPSVTSFTRIYNRLRRERPADALRAAQACREVVGTQKTIHPAEQGMLDALNKPLPKVAAARA